MRNSQNVDYIDYDEYCNYILYLKFGVYLDDFVNIEKHILDLIN